MRFETYISDLLYRHECVVIPELGALLTRTVSASMDAHSHTFFPPRKVLSFNENVQTNDGLLVKYISDVERIPYEKALKKVLKKVRTLKSYMAGGETVVFEAIGDFRLNDEGKLVFEPFKDLNYLTHAFGLEAVVSPAILRTPVEVRDQTKVVPIGDRSENKTRLPLLRYASVAILALTMGGWLTSNYYLDQIESHNLAAQQEADKVIQNKVQEATFVIDNPLPTVTFKVDQQSGNFHVVAGAFRYEANCNKKLKQLQALGFNARKIGVNAYGLHQVVYSSYETRSEAQRALYQIRKTHDSEAWLLIKELN